MTTMQERAFEMIMQMPEDKVYYVVKMLEGIEGLFPEKVSNAKTVEQKAYEKLQDFRRCSAADTDYKSELRQALEEKYARAD